MRISRLRDSKMGKISNSACTKPSRVGTGRAASSSSKKMASEADLEVGEDNSSAPKFIYTVAVAVIIPVSWEDGEISWWALLFPRCKFD